MPNAQVIDLNAPERIESTSLEKTLSGFSKRHRENQIEQQDTDALRAIYSQYQNDGRNIERALIEAQTRPGISPTARVNTVKQLSDFQKYNQDLQNKTAEEVASNAKIVDLEKRRNLPPGSLEAYKTDPKMAEQVSRPDKKTQASQPVDEDQLKRIEHTMNQPGFNQLSPSEQNLALIRNGVSKENSGAVIQPKIEEAKVGDERKKILRQEQAKADIGFVAEQTQKIPEIFNRQQTLDQAAVLNQQGVTGNPWDLAMQKVGLLQFTSDGYRVFSSLAKDAVKNQNIKDIIGSQISQMEFKFFQEATINPNFSKEANNQIIKKESLVLRYQKLYADITKRIVEENGGEIPERIQQKVNDQFAKQSEKISQELKEAAIDFDAIQNVPPGKVLMYDKKRRPLHVTADQVEKYSKPPYGASLS